MPDNRCTLWLNGIPEFLGGTGEEWLHCCIDHDFGASHWQLAQCVAETSPIMAVIMFVGVAGPLGIGYRFFTSRRNSNQ
jgi:hypothetical protein